MSTTTYKVVRFYQDGNHPDHGKVIATGATLEEAQEHCQDETTQVYGADGLPVWFDGFTAEEDEEQ